MSDTTTKAPSQQASATAAAIAPPTHVVSPLQYRDGGGGGSASQDIMLVVVVAMVIMFVYMSSCRNWHHQRTVYKEQLQWPATSTAQAHSPNPMDSKAPPPPSLAVTNAAAPVVAISAKFATTVGNMLRQIEPSNLIRAVSARYALNMHAASCIKDASEVFDTIPQGVLQIISHGNGQASDDQKARCNAALRQWLAHPKNTNGAIMLYAPWCKHCHQAIPKFGSLASSNPAKIFLLVDSSSLPRTALSGKHSIHDVEYYPTYLQMTAGGKLKRVNTVEDLVRDEHRANGAAAAGGGAAGAGISAWFASVGMGGVAEASKDAAAVDPFASLFHS